MATSELRIGNLKRRKRDKIWTFKYALPNQREWKPISTRTRERAEAKKFQEDFRNRCREGYSPIRTGCTFREAAAEWLNFKATRTIPNTVRSYSTCLSAPRRLLGDFSLARIDRVCLESYQQRRKREGVSNRHINHEVAYIRSILERNDLWDGRFKRFEMLALSKSENSSSRTSM